MMCGKFSLRMNSSSCLSSLISAFLDRISKDPILNQEGDSLSTTAAFSSFIRPS